MHDSLLLPEPLVTLPLQPNCSCVICAEYWEVLLLPTVAPAELSCWPGERGPVIVRIAIVFPLVTWVCLGLPA